MKRILVITNNLQQASFRLRIAELLPALRQRGFELDVQVRPRSLLARRRLLGSAGQYDATLLQRKLLDPSDARLLRRQAPHIFFDVDDAVMFHSRPVGRFAQWRTMRRFRATARIADLVVAGNAYLADLFAREGARTAILPTVVDPARYAVRRHGPASPVRLVWIGSRSTLPYLQQCVPFIEEAAARVPALSLLTIADATVHSTRIAVEHIPWSVDSEAPALASADIGIAPTPSDRWTLGKCGFKIVQYMAAGLPVIASPVGANAEIVRDGETGLLPTAWKDWPAAIARLADDVELRARWGATARQLVEQQYSITRAADQWARWLGSV